MDFFSLIVDYERYSIQKLDKSGDNFIFVCFAVFKQFNRGAIKKYGIFQCLNGTEAL